VGCPENLTVKPGFTLFEVQYDAEKRIIEPQILVETSFIELSHDPIPADFFDPGSDPFSGRIDLQGWPLGSSPLYDGNLGNTDTIIELLQGAQLDEVGQQVQIPVKLVEISLQNIQSIGIPFNGGAEQQLWNLDLTLSPDEPQPGTIIVGREQADGGLVNGEIPVLVRLTFTRMTDGAVRYLDREDRLVIKQAPWHIRTNDLNWSQEQTSNVVPGLDRVPIISWLFRRQQVAFEGRELLIFVTPTIIRE